MGLFDSITGEAAEKFNLGDKTGGLFTILISMITDSGQGGFSGFLDRFKEAGLGGLAASWVNSGANMPLSFEQTETVFGEGTLKEVSEAAGLDYKTTTSATAFIVPHIVDNLTPDGEVPDEKGLLSMIAGLAPETGGSLGKAAVAAAGAAADAVGAGKAAVGAGIDAVGDKVDGLFGSVGENLDGGTNSLLKVILPLIIIALLAFAGYKFWGTPSDTAVVANSNSNANKAPAPITAPPAKPVDSSFSLKAENGKYAVSGVVKDDAAKKQITDAVTAQFGEGNVDFAGLKVDAGARPFGPGWWENFGKMLPGLKDWKTGELSFAGDVVTAAVGLPQAAVLQLKSLFATGWRLPASIAGEADAAKQANEEALKELADAKTVDQVVGALNVSIINFASGSSAIPADAQAVLQKAADVLKAQPADAKIEIGGHTDSDGNDDSNLKLSESRASSVKAALVKLGVGDAMLTAKGYGEASPAAPNDTPDNKFKNRRIEYKVTGGQ